MNEHVGFWPLLMVRFPTLDFVVSPYRMGNEPDA